MHILTVCCQMVHSHNPNSQANQVGGAAAPQPSIAYENRDD
jgi:hypothetical protein